MALVVFLRAVNVGGHQKFQPTVLAKALSHLDLINVGAAGTFVVRAKITPANLKKEILGQLPFAPDIMIVPSSEILKLLAGSETHFGKSGDEQRFLTVMAKAPKPVPKLPISVPDGKDWQVRIVAVVGTCVLSLRRPIGKRDIYPNEVVDKALKIPATTRNWTTVIKICEILSK